MSIITRLKPYMKWRYFLYLFAMIGGWPCVFSFMGWLPDWKMNYMGLAAMSVLTMLAGRSKQLPSPISALIIVQLLSFLIYYVIHSDSSYLTRFVFLVTTYALLSIQMAYPKTEFVDTNVSFLTVQAVMGGVGFVLTTAGILRPISTFVEFDGHTGTFFGLFTCNALYEGSLRVAGFFDEPGAFACWGIVALLFNKLFIENKTVERVLIVGLISTLSMAFFVQVALYTFLFYRQKMGGLIKHGSLFLIILFVIASITPELNDAIFGRFMVDEETGQLQGDNRSELTAVCFAYWQSSPIIGVGAEYLIQLSGAKGEFVGANIFTFFAADGLLGQIVLWLPTLYLLILGRKNKKYLYSAIILFVGYMQRPYDPTQIWYSLTIFTFILEGYREQYLMGDGCRSNIKRTNFIPLFKVKGYE